MLEDRDSGVELPGVEPGQPTSVIRLPERLYVIATMNLIDQSLEQIDFALRRRFLWKRSGFESERLAAVLPELWAETAASERHEWERISADMERLTERAELLNRADRRILASGTGLRDWPYLLLRRRRPTRPRRAHATPQPSQPNPLEQAR